jgi:PAP2 superfamily
MWLPWTYSLPLAGVFFMVGWLSRGIRPFGALPGAVATDRRATVGAVAFEATRVALLYTLWQLAGRLSVSGIERANERGLGLWRLERAMWLPSERWIQSLVIPHSWLAQAANLYYGGAHVPGMGVFLVWLFLRHRQQYPGWRNVLVVITFVSLIIQLIPVAPPRLIPSIGMLDTGVAYGQSVYAIGGSSVAGQLQAMPSLHVGWAALIALATWQVSRGRARRIGLGHLLLTFVVVTVTANHYWLDGIVCIALLIPAAVVLVGARSPHQPRRRWGSTPMPVARDERRVEV